MHNVRRWPNTLSKSCNIFKVCLTILRRYGLRGLRHWHWHFMDVNLEEQEENFKYLLSPQSQQNTL